MSRGYGTQALRANATAGCMVAGETDTPVDEPTIAVDADQLDTLPPTAPNPGRAAVPTEQPVATPLGSGYLLDRPIGSGATGRVYRGRRRADGALVAVKVLREDLARDPDTVVRFLRQRTVLRALHHPHLVRVHDLVAEGELLAVVMDLVEGDDLRRLPGRESLGTAAVLGLLGQVAEALAAVHAAGVVHRDIKPENVLVQWRDGRPHALLTDFGLAGAAAGPTDLTRMSQLLGTPAYVAPELVLGRPASTGTDIYGLGVMAYELLAGERPFHADNTAALLHAHVETEPPRPARLAEPTWQLVRAMLAKDPAARPSAAAVATRLAELRDAGRLPAPVPPPPAVLPPPVAPLSLDTGAGQDTVLPTTGATRPAPPAPVTPPRRRRRAPLVVAIVTIALLGAGIGVWLGRPDGATTPPPSTSAGPVAHYQYLPVAATSPEPGTIQLDFPEMSGAAGFDAYHIFRDGELVAEVPSGGEVPPYVAHRLDETTEYCWVVAALIISYEPPPSATVEPTCRQADGPETP
jgi:serine/threonine protein kinase